MIGPSSSVLRPPVFALIAGELSGDLLGAALIRSLRKLHPGARFYGVAGPRMIEAGCEAIASIEILSVMGLAEVLPALPRLFQLRAELVRHIANQGRPDLVIGIDAPDFNLGLERRLRERGLRTVHLVSPTVWAWRRGRVRGIVRAVDLLLCLFPFEPPFYAQEIERQALQKTEADAAPRRAFQARYIGHPLANELDASVTSAQARIALAMRAEGPVLAVLPGSRGSEIDYLSEPFVKAAAWLRVRVPGLRFVTPIAKPALRERFARAIARHAPQLDWTLLDGQSRDAMRAADVVLVASGTATLECLLLGRAMVVAYKGSPVTAWLMLKAGLLKTQYVSLPNLLSAKPAVTELLQSAATPERIGEALLPLLRDHACRQRQLDQFDAVRAELRRDAGAAAAEAITDLLRNRRGA
ncbi:MAG: lipid-A-disaccharide synthase [Hydrocarboniphaga sp.]|uniref:lipid-A-disaccharide synthase n=1 Tax=Hydrocarboniphaga sp. TaxID=2033016 RepID=UPI00262677BC|nr:lipid-A-disaccharide synthase [Hydrocarboniphaga sp.]MDB5968970.1 lipid-A-disaccharide synthase [Hydrocarboniphaga sp.]